MRIWRKYYIGRGNRQKNLKREGKFLRKEKESGELWQKDDDREKIQRKKDELE